ncbi:hypothetical protein GGF32_004237, partial [Allomyces javanicus]
DEALAAHAAVLKAGEDGDKINKDALNKLVDAIGTETAEIVSRDALLAHTLLLSIFYHKLRDGNNEAKDLAYLCTSETRYLAFLDALAKAVVTDMLSVDALPLPLMDVVMLMHSHMLSPLRFADEMTRRYGRAFVGMSMPLMRLVAMGANKDDLESSRQFWAKHLPADMLYDLTLIMPEYAALRLHGQEHMCAMCAAEFTAEHAAWAKYAAKLPTLATWADVKAKVMAPIMKDAAESLVLPGNRLRFAMVIHAHKDVITGPWSMDLFRPVRRQRRFSGKMANLVQSGPSAVYHFQTEALTLALTGTVMNHDDSDDAEAEARIADGAKETADLWMYAFDEEFLHPRVTCALGDTDPDDLGDRHGDKVGNDMAMCDLRCGVFWCDAYHTCRYKPNADGNDADGTMQAAAACHAE